MPLSNRQTIRLEEYKTLRSQITSEMAGMSTIFNYGLVTLGISFTAVQTIFNQINEIAKSSSIANIAQLNLLVILLWVLLVLFIPFICIVFSFKWLSNAKSIAITGCWIVNKVERYLPPLRWETEFRNRFRSGNWNLFLSTGGWHPIIVLAFFFLIGVVSQLICCWSIESNLLISDRVTFNISIIYIFISAIAVREVCIISRILRENQVSRLPRILNINGIFIIIFVVIFILSIFFFNMNFLNLWNFYTNNQGAINPVQITQEKLISTYTKNINSLIPDGLSENKKNSLSIARGLTLKTFERLDELTNQDLLNEGKSEIIRFLYDFGLIGSTQNDGIRCSNNESLNLRRVNLENIKLSRLNLQCINLKGASLKNAQFESTILIGADLSYSILINANFQNANLWNIKLIGTELKDANFTGANLKDAKSKKDDGTKEAKNYDNTGADLTGDTLKRWQHCQKNDFEVCDFYYQN